MERVRAFQGKGFVECLGLQFQGHHKCDTVPYGRICLKPSKNRLFLTKPIHFGCLIMQNFDENLDFHCFLEHFHKAKTKKDDQIAYTQPWLIKFNLTSSEKIEKIDSLQTNPN
jgi:hypothetical protein